MHDCGWWVDLFDIRKQRVTLGKIVLKDCGNGIQDCVVLKLGNDTDEQNEGNTYIKAHDNADRSVLQRLVEM